jgi:hypothetical protein
VQRRAGSGCTDVLEVVFYGVVENAAGISKMILYLFFEWSGEQNFRGILG